MGSYRFCMQDSVMGIFEVYDKQQQEWFGHQYEKLSVLCTGQEAYFTSGVGCLSTGLHSSVDFGFISNLESPVFVCTAYG